MTHQLRVRQQRQQEQQVKAANQLLKQPCQFLMS